MPFKGYLFIVMKDTFLRKIASLASTPSLEGRKNNAWFNLANMALAIATNEWIDHLWLERLNAAQAVLQTQPYTWEASGNFQALHSQINVAENLFIATGGLFVLSMVFSAQNAIMYLLQKKAAERRR